MFIRRATLVDMTNIQTLGYSVWSDTYAAIAPTAYLEAELSQAWSPERLTNTIQAPDSILLVAIEIDEVIGTIQTQILNQQEAVLWSCCVRQAYRGRGIGKLLVTATLWILPAGIENYFTKFLNTNTLATAFYAAQGFVFERTETKQLNGVPLAYTWMKRALRMSPPSA